MSREELDWREELKHAVRDGHLPRYHETRILFAVEAALADKDKVAEWLATPKDAAWVRSMEAYRARQRISIEQATLDLAREAVAGEDAQLRMRMDTQKTIADQEQR